MDNWNLTEVMSVLLSVHILVLTVVFGRGDFMPYVYWAVNGLVGINNGIANIISTHPSSPVSMPTDRRRSIKCGFFQVVADCCGNVKLRHKVWHEISFWRYVLYQSLTSLRSNAQSKNKKGCSIMKKKKVEAIDLFCGIGGLTYGLKKAKIKIIAGLDNDASCEYAYRKNNKSKFICEDIANYDFRKMKKMYSKDSIKVLVGCAPCQPFTPYARKITNKQNTIREGLIKYFVKAVTILKPHIISMENVRGLTQKKIFTKFVRQINNLGYKVDYKVVYCPNYGVPQTRYRLVLMASRLGEIEVPSPNHSKSQYITVGDAIKKLPILRDGGICPSDHVHRCMKLAAINKKRIKHSKPQGTWHDWPKNLLPDCYKKPSGQTYRNVYGRMSYGHVGPTITTRFLTYGTGRFGHPTQARAISLREGALLQTFPEDYDFGEDFKVRECERHIGNAVPPNLGEAIGQAILLHINPTI